MRRREVKVGKKELHINNFVLGSGGGSNMCNGLPEYR